MPQIATTLLYQCFINIFDFHLFINTGDKSAALFYSIFEIGFLLLFKDIKRNFTHIVAFRVFCSVIMQVLVIYEISDGRMERRFLSFLEVVDAGKKEMRV